MNFINVIALLVLSMLFAGCAPKERPENPTISSESTSSSKKSNTLENIDGFWVTEKYLSTLAVNKTPLYGNPESIEINIIEKKIKWTNYHEGYSRNIFEYEKVNSLYRLMVSEPESLDSEAKPFFFQYENGALVFIEAGIVEQVNERFIRIPTNLPTFVNKQILSGKYIDSEGNHYEFTDNGKAIWPNSSFDYEIILDSTEASCPYISSSMEDSDGSPKSFGYKWESEYLYIFEIVEGEDAPISCAKEALLKLAKK